MTTNYPPIEGQTTTSGSTTMMPLNYSDWSDDELLVTYDWWQQEQAKASAILGRMEQAIMQRMKDRWATAIPSREFVCQMETKDTYSQPAFTPLKEVFNEADLAVCFTAAHEETVQVPDRWTTVKVKALARRYGAEALAIVETARIPGAPRIKFERKKLK